MTDNATNMPSTINNNMNMMNSRVLINDDDTTHQSNSFIHHLDSDFNIINNNDYINQYNQVNHNN